MICRVCKSTDKPFKHNPCHVNSGICKPCHSQYNRELQKRKAIEMSPHNWFQCDDCDMVFSVRSGNGTEKRTCCMYCQSEEILTIAEQGGFR